MKLLLPISFALASTLSAAAEYDSSEKPRVYVHVDPRLENHDPDMVRELVDSMADLREQISKRHDIVGAKSIKDADILVTLLDRRIEVNRSGETKYFGYTQTHYQSRYVLTFRLEGGGTGLETDAALAGAFVTWKRVAGVVAKDIEEWARDHAETLNGEPSP